MRVKLAKLVLTFSLFAFRTFGESLVSNSPIDWSFKGLVLQNGKTIREIGGKDLLNSGISDESLKLICHTSLDPHFQDSGKRKRYAETIWIECKLDGVRVATDGISCLEGDFIESGGLNFEKADKYISIKAICFGTPPMKKHKSTQ